MWIVDTSSALKASYGFPPRHDNFVQCPLLNYPAVDQLAKFVQTDAPPTKTLITFEGIFITYTCNSLKEIRTPEKDAGVTPF